MSDSDDNGGSTAADVLEVINKFESLSKESQEEIKRLLFAKLVEFYAAESSSRDGYERLWMIESNLERFREVNPEGYQIHLEKKFEFLLELIEEAYR